MGHKLVIFDIDGTLANTDHRQHFVRNINNVPDFKPDWNAFFNAMIYDTPIPAVINVFNQYSANNHLYKVVLLTGRPEAFRLLTAEWFHKYGVRFKYLCMRADNDRRPDHECKLDLLYEFLLSEEYDTEDVEVIYEDRQQVVDWWRKNGFTCLQTAPSTF